jgi:response regulator RpfG family c-di-GMP phosphodiesterase
MSSPASTQPDELKRILVVDDEKVVLVSLRETLRLQGYEVFAVEDPVEALQLIQKTAFSVILSDQQMPTLTGLEFLAQAKEIQPHSVRILITAVLSLSTVIAAINKGEVYRFIVKPWLREELLVTIKNAVQRYELVSTNSLLHKQSIAMNQQLASQLAMLDAQNRQLDRLNQTLQQNLDGSIQLCLKTMETFYPLLGQQARRVFALCQAMAEDLSLSDEQRHVLEISSRLCDIGLVRVPRDLIRNWQQTPDNLNDGELALIELHPVLGQQIVAFVEKLEGVGTTIRAHHERYDGTGYPDRLSDEQIPWLARLLAVAVAYVSSASDELGLEFVKTNSGAAFDPDAVRAFMRCLPHASVPRSQREVLLSELQPGMVVAQGIYTAHSILLIPEGQVLTEPHINLVRNHNHMYPITQSLLVFG